jgi:TonB family protein
MSLAPRSLLVLSLALAAANAAAQSAATNQCDVDSLKPLPPLNASAQENVVLAIRQANTCLRTQNAACADMAVASVQSLGLSDSERALLAIPRADIATQSGDSAAAIAIYREALALPASGEFAWRQITWRLAALLNARGEVAETLRLISSTQCERWTAEVWALRAIAYQDLGARTFALESFQAAMKLYELEGRPVPGTFQERHTTLLAAEAPETPEGPEPVAFFRQNPAYPQSALADELDGWVQLEFDITDLGTVENVRAVASRDKVFEQPAVEAVQGWRYVPKFENRLPVRSDGKQTIITFCTEPCYFGNKPPPERGPDGRFYPAETR